MSVTGKVNTTEGRKQGREIHDPQFQVLGECDEV